MPISDFDNHIYFMRSFIILNLFKKKHINYTRINYFFSFALNYEKVEGGDSHI